jgi:hypothetical protein
MILSAALRPARMSAFNAQRTTFARFEAYRICRVARRNFTSGRPPSSLVQLRISVWTGDARELARLSWAASGARRRRSTSLDRSLHSAAMRRSHEVSWCCQATRAGAEGGGAAFNGGRLLPALAIGSARASGTPRSSRVARTRVPNGKRFCRNRGALRSSRASS